MPEPGLTIREQPKRTSPWPIPYGWFMACYPSDVAVGQVVPLRYVGRDLVAWRDEQGAVHVSDAFCPHLGAHLGYGGTVKDCELVCPFHGWTFDAAGNNTLIPYSERLNRKARLRAYPTLERNGMVWFWYHPADTEPEWDIPVVPQVDDDEFTDFICSEFVVHAPWQELNENSVDSAHFQFVHGTATVPVLEEYTYDGPHAVMRSAQIFVTPRGDTKARIDVDGWGPGFAITWFTGIVDTVLLAATTPIDEATVHVRFNFMARKLGSDRATSSVIDAFVSEINKQINEDIPIWEHKAYLPNPALADTDGPFLKFRKWASQFYADPEGASA